MVTTANQWTLERYNMTLTIITSRHSKQSAIALGEALDCTVYNPYQSTKYREGRITPKTYNMGCSGFHFDGALNDSNQIAECVDKLSTLNKLSYYNVTTVPWTVDPNIAQNWLDEDKIVVNRATTTGKVNEGLSYSFKGAEQYDDKPLVQDSAMWTRFVNHDYELRAYLIKGCDPLIYKKVDVDGSWEFKQILQPEQKLLDELEKAGRSFNKMFCVAFDILHCRTGDYYFLEANSAPSLLVHPKILPTLVSAIKRELEE